jgi:hypothetical protein
MQRTWPRGLPAELHQRRDGYPALRRAAERVGLVRIGASVARRQHLATARQGLAEVLTGMWRAQQ